MQGADPDTGCPVAKLSSRSNARWATLRRVVAGAVGRLCLLAFSVQGVDNTWQNRDDIETIAQWLMSLAQLGYAVIGLVVVVLWWARSTAVHMALVGWCVTFVAAVTLILPAWAPEDLELAPWFFLAACGGAAAVGGWLWYFGPRPSAAPRASASVSARSAPPG